MPRQAKIDARPPRLSSRWRAGAGGGLASYRIRDVERQNIFDGLVKTPTSALCCISQSFNVRKVHLMITKFARLEFELFTKPSKSDFLRVHHF